MPRTRHAAGLLAAALLVTVTACDSDGGDGGWGSGSAWSVQGALAQLPAAAPDATVLVQAGDLVTASEAAGVERPDDLDGQALVDWLGPLTGGPGAEEALVFVPIASLFNAPRLLQHEEFADELGFSVLDAEAFVEQSTPPATFAVVAGDLDGALRDDLPEVADGVVTAGEGEDLAADVANQTVARPLGMPLRLAERPGLVAASPGTTAVADWVAGPERTMADHDELAAVASALDDADVLAAALATGSSMALADALGETGSPEQVAALEADLGAVLPPAPFRTVGIGWGVEDGAADVTIAYHFGTEEAAESAEPAFEAMFAEGDTLVSRQPLSELLTLDGVDRDGPVVVLDLSLPDGVGPRVVFDLYVSRDLPFAHR